MRLIDADDLIKSLQIDQEICFGCPEPEWMDELIQIVDSAPTVEIENDFVKMSEVIEAVNLMGVFLGDTEKEAVIVGLESFPYSKNYKSMTKEQALAWLKQCAENDCDDCDNVNKPIAWCDEKMRECVRVVEDVFSHLCKYKCDLNYWYNKK